MNSSYFDDCIKTLSLPSKLCVLKKTPLTALVITYNEIDHIERLINNISFADEIIIVDSYSNDGTAEYIKNHSHVQLIQRAFKNFTDQKQFAVDQATNDWVLFVDADEDVPLALQTEIEQTINQKDNNIVAYWFYRAFMFYNKRLYFSGWQTDKVYRLFRKSQCEYIKDRIVHETLTVNGKEGKFKNKLTHYAYSGYEDYKGRMIKYGQLKALQLYKKDKKPNVFFFYIAPIYKFLNHFILRLGFLDGKKGVTISYLNALGVYEKYQELKRLRITNSTQSKTQNP